jgi:hypothetical protein
MNKRKKELDVDQIGEQRDLTKEEEQAISDFIKLNKQKKAKHPSLILRATKRKKVLA